MDNSTKTIHPLSANIKSEQRRPFVAATNANLERYQAEIKKRGLMWSERIEIEKSHRQFIADGERIWLNLGKGDTKHPPAHKSATLATIQMQGSVLRVKTTQTMPQKGRVFERGWNSPEQTENRAIEPNKHEITEFSRSSRRTLQDKLMSLSDNALVNCKFVTLTYHEQIPTPQDAKAHLRAFYKRVIRYVRKHTESYKPAMFWRIEVKARKSGVNAGKPAPHFHLFLFGCPFIPRSILLRWWREITGDETIEQLDIKRLDNRRKVMNYVSKYVSKQGENMPESTYLDIALYQAEVGRWWGFEGRENIPFDEIIEARMTYGESMIQALVRFAEERFPFLRDRWSYGFRLFFFGSIERDMFKQVVENLVPNFDSAAWGWIDSEIE